MALFLPPVAVFIEVGCGVEFWLDCLLTLLGWIPGVIYALFVIFRDEAAGNSAASPPAAAPVVEQHNAEEKV